MSTEPLEPPEPLPFDGVVGTGVTGVCEGCATLIVTLELGVSVEPAVTLWLTMVPGISSSLATYSQLICTSERPIRVR